MTLHDHRGIYGLREHKFVYCGMLRVLPPLRLL